MAWTAGLIAGCQFYRPRARAAINRRAVGRADGEKILLLTESMSDRTRIDASQPVRPPRRAEP
jgi:hypothetical protein